MPPPQQPVPPTWVRKRDGRVVPFEADRLSRALFAATETAGRGDAFLARELADVAVHFLADELDDPTPTTAQVAEVVVKVLRQLKQHELAEVFEEHARRKAEPKGPRQKTGLKGVIRYALEKSPSDVRDECMRTYTLQAVYPRDLAGAHRDGLLTLGGLETPCALASCLVAPPGAGESGWPRLLEGLAACPAEVAVLEGTGYALARSAPPRSRRGSHSWAEKAASGFVQELLLGLRLTNRRAVLNLNGPPPPWADEAAQGPLFAAQGKAADDGWPAELCDALLDCESLHHPAIRVDWHLAEHDFTAASRERLVRVVRAALAGNEIAFVFDRPRRPLSLAEGVQRRLPAVLLTVGLHLPRLAALAAEEGTSRPGADPTKRFLEKLRSLARLALSAAVQKREFVRRHPGECPALARGFLLERARLLVAPLGLDEAVRRLHGDGLCASEEALAFGCEAVRTLHALLRDEGRASALETCIDASGDGTDPAAPVKTQLSALGELHAAGEGGPGTAFLPAEPAPTADEVTDWLRWAWRETDAERLRLVRTVPAARQLTFAVSEGR
jgi:hypothetical protein